MDSAIADLGSELNNYATINYVDTQISTKSSATNIYNGTGEGSVQLLTSIASGNYSVAFGSSTASAYNSHAEGESTTASGRGSHSEGHHTEASGSYSHAEGNHTSASAEYAHAEGQYAYAEGYASHAQGASTYAKKTCSFVGGQQSTADANFATAIGLGLNATAEASFVVGKYNQSSNALFVVGNGSTSGRSNAFTVHTDGHAEVKTAGTTDTSVVRRVDLPKQEIWVPTAAPVSTTITSANGKS